MMSKKDALTLVVLGVGGVTVASAFAGGEDGGEGGAIMEGLRGVKGRMGGIPGGAPPPPSPTVYQFAAQPAVRFPAAPSFDMSSLFPSEKLAAPAPAARGAAGISGVGKKRPSTVTPYIYTGGEIKTGAVSVAPWAVSRTTPTEMGVTTALRVARGGSGGTSKKKPSTFSSKSYQKGYKARATKRYAAARKKRMSKKENTK